MRKLRHHAVPPGAQGLDPHSPRVRLQGVGGSRAGLMDAGGGPVMANELEHESNPSGYVWGPEI